MSVLFRSVLQQRIGNGFPVARSRTVICSLVLLSDEGYILIVSFNG